MKFGLASVSLILLTVALAGCADDPPSGEFASTGPSIAMTGDVSIEYVSFNDPLGIAQNENDITCTNRQALPADQHCRSPSTTFNVHFMPNGIPQPDASTGYSVVAMSTATPEPLMVGELTQGADGMWALNNTFDSDLESELSAVELRMGDLTVATANTAGGTPNAFETVAELRGVSFEGSYKGKQLDMVVSGIPTNVTGVGWLVMMNEEGGMDHSVSFPVMNGEVSFAAESNIADYAEVHIHAGGSKINLGIAPIA